MNRRNFLRIAGSAGIVVAAAGASVGSFIATRDPQAALAPWRTAGSQYADPMRRALSYAILAPNPHNRQPWVVDLKSDREAVLSCDLGRLLPVTDPFSRQIVIGLGCFLELFALAASNDGHRARIRLFPDGEPSESLDQRPIAHLQLTSESDMAAEPLFANVLDRHTNRNPYDTERPVAPDALREIVAAGSGGVSTGGVGMGPQLTELRTLTRDAMRDELLDARAHRESVDLIRIGRTEIEANPDGISLRGAFLEALNGVGILTRETIADPESRAFQLGMDMAAGTAMTAMGFVWITTDGNDRRDQIAAGRSYMRIALQVSSLGLAMQPMSQALQEYAAMQPHYERVHELLTAGDAERVQMLARLGYSDAVAPAPRWPLSTRIKSG